MNECDLILSMLNRDNYITYAREIDIRSLSGQVSQIMLALNDYWTIHQNVESISIEDVSGWFLQQKSNKLTEDEIADYRAVFETIKQNGKQHDPNEIVKDLKLKRLSNKLMRVASRGVKDIESLKYDLEAIEQLYQPQVEPLQEGIDALITVNDMSDGYKWGLDCLTHNIHPMPTKGVFIVVAARPEGGKTSFIVSQVASFVKQMPKGKKVLWLNNENMSGRIKGRYMASILGIDWASILQAEAEGKDPYKYYLAETDNEEKAIFYDVHGFSTSSIESLIKKHKDEIALIVLDMIDLINISRQLDSATFNSDSYYGMLYNWLLGVSCKYASVIGTSQINKLPDDDEMRHKYPLLEDLSGSKTLKQGAASCMIMLGQDPSCNTNIRYLSTPKNKYGRSGSSWRAMAEIQPKICRFKEVK